MALFPQAQGIQVNQSQLTANTTTTNNNTNTNNYNTYPNGPTGIDLLREASALEAIHDSSTRPYPPRCFPGTREQYIEDIVARATPTLDNTPLPIYWMKGPAGVGKSAIAQTCAERLVEQGALGASFFFSVSGQHDPDKFFPSIAYQLSTRHPAYRDLVDDRIRQDKALVRKAMRFQFQYLIDEPLRELEGSGKGIRKAVQIFVDGLDECEGTDAQCEIIQIIATGASGGVLPLRWAFFSRPEPRILASFSQTSVAPYCHRVELPISRDADGEIEVYLRHAFDNILKHNNPSTQTLWPSTEDMKIIVHGAGGSFIYATTVVRFLSRPDSLSPQKRLLVIIDVIFECHSRSDTNTTAPLAELDAFYTLILQRVPPEAFQSIHLLLAHMSQTPISGVMCAANTLMMSKDEFETTCHHLSAVIRFDEPGKELELGPSIDTGRAYTQANEAVPSEVVTQIISHLGGQVSFYHKSFYDFLLDPYRSGGYCVKDSEALAKHLVKLLLDYDRSFSWRGSELVLAPGVPDSAASLSYPYTNELTNSYLKDFAYHLAGIEDRWSFPVYRGALGPDTDRDFHKWLHVSARFDSIWGTGSIFPQPLWGFEGQGKWLQGSLLIHISHNNFLTRPFVSGFKSMAKRRELAGIIRRYHPSLTSRIKSLFRNKNWNGVESTLYRMGHGKKAVYCYWEINHKHQYFRSFCSIDLAEGEKRFREEDFDSWSKHSSDDDDNGSDDDSNHSTSDNNGDDEQTKSNDKHDNQNWDENEGGEAHKDKTEGGLERTEAGG